MIAADALSAILDRKGLLDGGQQEGQNNLALADQFQFSSLLKLYVTPPEKEIQNAQGEPDPLANKVQPAPRDAAPPKAAKPKQAERPDRPKEAPAKPKSAKNDEPEVKFDPAEAKQDLSHTTDNKQSDEPERVEVPSGKPQVKADNKAEEQVKAPKVDSDDLDVVAVIASANSQVVDSTASATKTDPAPTNANNAEAPKSAPAPTAQSKTNPGQAALIAAALANGKGGDDVESAAAAKAKSDGNASKTANTNPNPLAAQQAADLGQRLGLTDEPNQVSVKVETTNSKPTPSPNLTANAVLANEAPEGDGKPAFTTTDGKSDGRNVMTDRQALAAAASQNGTQSGPVTTETMFINLYQAIRQNMMTSGPNAGPTVAEVAANANAVTNQPATANGTAALGGPSQLTETAKTTPTAQPRPPVPTRSPAEQIAVQIQKGIGAGADKISIKLHPEHLGRVEVKLEVGKDGHLMAAISADRPDTLQMLQRDARILQQALHDAGLQTDSDSLSFMLHGENSNQALPEDRGTGMAGGMAGDADLSDATIEDVAAANVAYGLNVAGDGHVDITV